MQSKTVAAGLLLAGTMLTGFSVDSPLYLGRSALEADAITSNIRIDRDSPTADVKVTNRTGKKALLVGWLGQERASAVVPARSSIVELSWQPVEGESAILLLRLYPDSDAVPRISDTTGLGQSEEHLVEFRSVDYTTPPHTPTPTPSTTPSGSKPPLPVTGANTGSYVKLGSGLLGFGVVMLGLAWFFGRRRRDSSTEV